MAEDERTQREKILDANLPEDEIGKLRRDAPEAEGDLSRYPTYEEYASDPRWGGGDPPLVRETFEALTRDEATARFAGPEQKATEFAVFGFPLEVHLRRPFDPNLGSIEDEDKHETGRAMIGEAMDLIGDLKRVIERYAKDHGYEVRVEQSHLVAEIQREQAEGDLLDRLIDALARVGVGSVGSAARPPQELIDLLKDLGRGRGGRSRRSD